MFYRVRQFAHAFFPHINSTEVKWVTDSLSPAAGSLFFKQSLSEQRHAIAVAQSIMPYKQSLSDCDFNNLLTAALLHDCGKSTVSIRLWHRVFIVLMQKMPQYIWSRLEASHSLFALPLQIATQHASWGERLAQKAGLNSEICLLIRQHHNPQTELGRILTSADNEH